MANIRLAFARIPRLDEPSDAYRLFLAEELLDAGMSPAGLMKGLGFDAPARGLAKYDPSQPRVPAGSGRNSGTMIEAKGPGYAGLMKSDFLADKIRDEEWLPQAGRQVAAAGSRMIEWYFAEPEAADKAREWFRGEAALRKIKVFYVPAEAP
ncbi:MAG: hypothetical protein WB816_08210 [Methylocystis sp.]